MGKGKGAVSYWAMPVGAGTTVVGMSGLFRNKARKALNVAATKLPVRTTLDIKDFFIDWDDFLEVGEALFEKKRIRREPIMYGFLKPTL